MIALLKNALPKKVFIATLMSVLSVNAWAGVYIEPSEVLVHSNEQVPPGRHISYEFTLERGTRLISKAFVETGITPTTEVWFLREKDYQRFISGEKFRYLTGVRHVADKTMFNYFNAPSKGLYYVVIDRLNDTTGATEIRSSVYITHPRARKQDGNNSNWFKSYLDELHSIIDFSDVQVSVIFCDIRGYRKLAEITICKDGLLQVPSRIRTDAITFSFYMQFAQAMLQRWEHAAPKSRDVSELATYLAYATGNEEIFKFVISQYESLNKNAQDTEPFITAKQASYVQKIILNKNELMQRWHKRIAPRATYSYLQKLYSSNEEWIDKKMINQQRAFVSPTF